MPQGGCAQKHLTECPSSPGSPVCYLSAGLHARSPAPALAAAARDCLGWPTTGLLCTQSVVQKSQAPGSLFQNCPNVLQEILTLLICCIFPKKYSICTWERTQARSQSGMQWLPWLSRNVERYLLEMTEQAPPHGGKSYVLRSERSRQRHTRPLDKPSDSSPPEARSNRFINEVSLENTSKTIQFP